VGGWQIAGVESEITEVHNKFQTLTDNAEEDEAEGGDCQAWPVVGKGGKVGKGGRVIKKERFEKVDKFKKIDKINFADAECGDVKFVGAVEQGENQITMGLCFQVTDVRKPLVAVKRIAEKRILVKFGPSESGLLKR